jgi:hypothetical protein
MTKKNFSFSKPEFRTFEEYKEWFKEFAQIMGAKGDPVSDEDLRKTWLKLKGIDEEKQKEEEKGKEGEEGEE